MNKKLMLLAAGVLSALAFAALPALASADEFQAHCEGAAECTGEITGGTATLENSAGSSIKCTAVGGSTSFATTTTTGTANLKFTGCAEQETIFHFSCKSAAAPNSGEILVNNLVYHVINLEETPSTVPGIKFTGVNVTFICAGFANKTVTGEVIGEIENPSSICNTSVTTHSVDFAAGAATGSQKWTQTETTGPITDLISNNHEPGNYKTSSQIATGTIHWNKPVKITC